VLFSGPAAELLQDGAADAAAGSRTRAFLRGEEAIAVPRSRRPGTGALKVVGATARNLQGVDAVFRLGAFNAVTGVSGSGKSTLVRQVLGRALARRLHGARALPGPHAGLEGASQVDKLIEIDQSPIGRTPRSNPATYTKVHDQIRGLLAAQPLARERGWNKGRFSFNVKGGRCEACHGAGVQAVGMHYLADVEVVCEACHGRRFNEQTLQVRYRGHSVVDILALPAGEALELLSDSPRISRVLQAMVDVGLGYLPLGQPATTLSGGEAQRVKLSAELGRPGTGKTLYVLDEPTTGLHSADIEVLLRAIQGLVERGNTAIVIEHNMEVVKTADWVLDLGPDSGAGGGRLVATGTPEQVAATEGSHTGAALRPLLEHTGRGEPALPPIEAGRGHEDEPDLPPMAMGSEEGGMASLPGHEDEPDLRLTGVTTHNLQAVDVQIPAGKITAVTGVSGSGKSSLALDTIVAAGQHRYTACLSTFARRFMRRARRGEAESITGLTPVIAIGQQARLRAPRSTLGTLTGIQDDLRLLYSRVGQGAEEAYTARHFSFNHHLGACEACKGLGAVTRCDPRRLVSHPVLPLVAGAMDGHKSGAHYGEPDGQHVATLLEVGRRLGLDFSLPWQDLSLQAREVAMRGTGEQVHEVTWKYKRVRREGEHRWSTTWAGFANLVEEEYQRKHADGRGAAMLSLMRDEPCPGCRGMRLRPEVLAVREGGLGIGDLCARTVWAAARFFEDLEGGQAMDPRALEISAQLRGRILERLRALDEVGLSYLSLQRQVSSLSRGEAQRARLAGALGAGLQGLTYVLDEPTIGLHERDTRRLLATMRRLCQEGNTVIVVEHDAGVVAAADHVLDLGPGAGEDGGRLVYSGHPGGLRECESSLTGRGLRRGVVARVRGDRRRTREGIRLRGARANNLQGFDLHIPAGGLVAISGVSGSGKSSLVMDLLLASAEQGRPVGCQQVRGLDAFGQVVAVVQGAVTGPANSNPATYCGAYDGIRRVFAGTEGARRMGFTGARFTLQRKGGRCEDCRGEGSRRVGMGFLSDVRSTCDTCRGARFDADTLRCRHRGQTIADVLRLTVEQALELFADHRRICQRLEPLRAVGLGYLRLGQQTRTLSSGEAQRLRLSSRLHAQLARRGPAPAGGDLLLFDEPTTGLHLEDVDRLLGALHNLADAGDTLLVIEHHPDVLAHADWIIDLGPEGGEGGGQLVGQGTPEDLAGVQGSYTGEVLRRVLGL